MQLTAAATDWLLGQFGDRLVEGALLLMPGAPGRTFAEPLVHIPLAGFVPAGSGVLTAGAVPTVLASASGQIGWAQLVTSANEALATLTVDTVTGADVVVPRFEVQKDQPVSVNALNLRLPRGQGA